MLFPKISPLVNNFAFRRQSLWNRNHREPNRNILEKCYATPVGVPGGGVGKGSGGGLGNTPGATGSGIGKFAAASEATYFRSKEQEKLKQMKKRLKLKRDESLGPAQK